MKRFNLILAGQYSTIDANAFKQDGSYVAFYVRAECIGLARLAKSDSIMEDTKFSPKPCPDCGYSPNERGAPVVERKFVSAETT